MAFLPQIQTVTSQTLDPGNLRIAAFAGFAPFAWREGSVARGRDITFLKRFADSQRLDFSVEFFDFDRLWELPAQGLADIAASGISLLPEKRKAPVTWSKPYSEVRRSLLIRAADANRFKQMADLKNARLAVVASSAAHDHARETLPPSATLSFCESLERGISELLSGEIDAVGTGDASARHHVSNRAGFAMVDVHRSRTPEFLSFAVRSDGSLRSRLDTFIAENAARY